MGIYGCKSWKCCTIIKPLSFWLLHNGIQEQIAASHEFDGVRKEKERLTAATFHNISRQQISSLFLFYSFIYGCKSWKCCTIIKPLSFWLLHNGIQEQIAASQGFDGVRKEKERLTAA